MLPGIGAIELVVILSISALLFGIIPLCLWRIVEKTGYPAWWSLGVLLPGVNVALLIMLAFGDWPALQTRRPEESL